MPSAISSPARLSLPNTSINKTVNGGTSYQASYTPVTNQVSMGATASYDANGTQRRTSGGR